MKMQYLTVNKNQKGLYELQKTNNGRETEEAEAKCKYTFHKVNTVFFYPLLQEMGPKKVSN